MLDVFVFEVLAAHRNPTSDVLAVRDYAKTRLLQFGTGEQAIRPFLGEWQKLQRHLQKSEQRQREVMALAGSKYINNEKISEVDIAVAKINSEEDSKRFLKDIQQRVKEDINKHGDKKISDRAFIEKIFVDIMKEGEKLRALPNPALRLLQSFGIERNDLSGLSTWAQIGELAAFYKQLKIASPILVIDFVDLKKIVRMENLPSWTIKNGLRRNRDRSLKREGSELTDRHLACLSTYADLTLVDKRIKENLTRALKKEGNLLRLITRVEKVSHFREIVRHLV